MPRGFVSARRAPFVRGTRRKTEWFGRTIVTAPISLAANSVILDSTFSTAEAAKRPLTVVRVRGLLYVTSDQQVARETGNGAIGMAVVSDQALAIGVTALPLPLTDASSDKFLLWMPFSWGQHASAGTPIGFEFPFDSKAMRKVQDGEALVMVVQNASSSFGIDYQIMFRILVKLH